MPEGPEVHSWANRLRPFLQGQVPLIECEEGPYRGALENLQGQAVRRVYARGKALVIEFESAISLYVHLQLYGRWQLVKPSARALGRRSLRFSLSVGEKQARLFSATDIEVLSPGELARHPYLSKLGPDLNDTSLTPEDFQRQLLAPAHCNRQLSLLLLDQSFWAGSGNYLRSEILFCAGIAPERRPSQLDFSLQRRLVQAGLGLARRSLALGGVTNHPSLVQVCRQAKLPPRRYRHWVFSRARNSCWLCGQPILQDILQGRRFFRCSGCRGASGLALDFSDQMQETR